MKRFLCATAVFLGAASVLFGAATNDTIDLKQAIAQALTSGPDIKVAQLTLNNARSQLDQAKAQDGFSLSANTGYTRQAAIKGSAALVPSGSGGQLNTSNLPADSANGSLSLSGPSTTASVSGSYGLTEQPNSSGQLGQQGSVGLSLKQTLYDGYPGGRAAASLQEAQYSFQLAQIAFDSAKDNVIYSVSQAYYTMLGGQNTVKVREATLKQSQEDLARTMAYFNANQATKLDVLTSQIAEQTAQADLASAQNALEQDRSSLAVLLGLPIDKQYSVAEVPEPSPPSIGQAQAVKTALDNRAELKQYVINRESDTVGLKSAEAQGRPTVAVNGGASYSFYPGVTPNANGGSWNAGVTVSVPIFDSGLVSSKVAAAKASLAQIGVQEAQTKQNITIAVRTALFAVKDASERLKLAKESVTQAQGEYNLEKIKFSTGLASNLDVINASVTLVNAQVALETAKTNLYQAILSLEKSMGTLSATPH